MPTTRHKAALRRAEGHPPSPQNEENLPRELRATQRRKKKNTRTMRSTFTPDSGEDSASQQNQAVPAQTLREGNAGGYVRDNTSEQQHFFPEFPNQTRAFLSSGFAQEHRGSDEATTQDDIASFPPSPVQTPPHSPTPSPSSPVTQPESAVSRFKSALPARAPATIRVPNTHAAVDGTRAAVSVSTGTDGLSAVMVSPTTTGTGRQYITSSVSTATTQTSPFIPRACRSTAVTQTSPFVSRSCRNVATTQTTPSISQARSNPATPTQTMSTRKVTSADKFRDIGLCMFRSELAVSPESCSLTLHLGHGRDIRVSKLSSAALDQIKEILHDPTHLFQRNWLTSEGLALEAAAAADDITKELAAKGADATETQPPSSTKRKRSSVDEDTPIAQRRRLDPPTSSTPAPPLSLNPLRTRSRMRKNGSLAGRPQTARTPVRSVSSTAKPAAATVSTVRYGHNGSLRLLGAPHRNHQQRDSTVDEAIVLAAPTESTSADEGEESILEWPVGPYWDTTQTSLQQTAEASSQSMAPEPEPESDNDSSQTQEVVSADAEQASTEESTAPATETPQPSRWRFGSILSSARRLIPGIAQRQAPLPVPQTVRPTARTQSDADSHDQESNQREVRTEPRRQDQRAESGPTDSTSSFAQRLRNSQTTTQKSFRSKENIEEIRKMKAEKERLAAEWAKLEEERKITEQERKDVEDAHRLAYASQQPGSKRPHRPSPRVIPNPKGVSYGLDPAYFDSSDEDEDELEPTPSRTHRPRKTRRISSPETSHSGTTASLNDEDSLFSKSVRTSSPDQALQYHGSIFSDAPPNAFQVNAAQAKAKKQARKDAMAAKSQDQYSSFNYSGHFQVPLSDSSSDEDDVDEASEETASEEQSTPLAPDKITSGVLKSAMKSTVQLSSTASSSSATGAASSRVTDVGPSKIPVTPAPAPRTVRFANGVDPSETLQRNRQKLRDQMQQLHKQKTVPSPQESPQKSQRANSSSESPTRQSSTLGSSSVHQPKDIEKRHTSVNASAEPLDVESSASNTKDDFSIRGAAKHVPVDESPYLFVDSLPPDMAQLHGYKDYQDVMAPKVKDLVESSWKVGDVEEAEDAFQYDLADFSALEEAEIEAQDDEAESPSLFIDDPDEDDASFYPSEIKKGDQSTAKALNAAQRETADHQPLEPAVAAYLDSNWTPEDEAYASDEFKEYLQSCKESDSLPQNAATKYEATF